MHLAVQKGQYNVMNQGGGDSHWMLIKKDWKLVVKYVQPKILNLVNVNERNQWQCEVKEVPCVISRVITKVVKCPQNAHAHTKYSKTNFLT